MNDFLQRLRERKLVQWALAYVAGAFALLQGLDIVAQQFGWPDGLRRGITIALAVGFFVALVLAWYHGERGAQRVTGTELLILALLLAIGGGALWRIAPSMTAADSHPSTAAPQATLATAVASVPIDHKSIAVLPFENLSDDKANAYFASGMQDMILTKLAAIGDLKVISRTSTEKYKSHPDNLKIVAAELGVATLLEGSVQKAGNQVLINVQLIDASTDNHLWADAYPRTLENIFGVEGEVAQKVADALKAKLTPVEAAKLAKPPTQNAAAYDLYLQASTHANRANDYPFLVPVETPRAIALYLQALEKDSTFALAAADLARAHIDMYFFAPDRTTSRLDAAKAAADRALALQPDLGEAHIALGLYYYRGYRDYARATEQLEIARRALPNSVEVVADLAAIARRQGRWDESLAYYREATLLDPRNAGAKVQLALTYQNLRRYADADQAFSAAVSIGVDQGNARLLQGFNAMVWKGDLRPLQAAIETLKPGSDSYSGSVQIIYLLHWRSRDPAGAAKVAERSELDDWVDFDNVALPRQLYLAWALQAAGEKTKAATEYTAVQARMRAELLAQPDSVDRHLALGLAEAGLGNKTQAIAEGERAAALMPVDKDAIVGPSIEVFLAQLYVRVGEPDQAIARITQLLAIPAGSSMSIALLKIDPVWDPLRNDPRFEALLAKYAADDKDAAHE